MDTHGDANASSTIEDEPESSIPNTALLGRHRWRYETYSTEAFFPDEDDHVNESHPGITDED